MSETATATGPERSAGEADGPRALAQFAAAAARLLGAERVDGPADGLLSDTLHRAPADRVLVRPTTTAEVASALDLARAHGQSVHPYSTGRNWGYGSSYPVADRTRVMLDLSAMNRILSFDAELGLVTVEPGVTQGDLAAFLSDRQAPFITPTTGAGPSCSLIGNALERGYGLTPIGDHFGAVMGIEAVLADGTIYRSPFMPEAPDGPQPVYKWGTGPYLDGVFSQAGNAVVTRMTLRLAPRPERVETFYFIVRDDALLEQCIEAIRRMLLDSGMPISGINFVNNQRMKAQVAGDGTMDAAKWFGTGVLFGDKAIVKASRAGVPKALKGLVRRVFFINDDRVALARRALSMLGRSPLAARLEPFVTNSEGLLGILGGQPSEFGMPLAYARNLDAMPATGRNPARDGCGLLWYVPIVPMRGADARRYADMVRRVCGKYGFPDPITFSSLSPTAFDSTVPLSFEPTEEGSANAMACLRELIEEGRRAGFPPYRYHSLTMDLATAEQPVFWQTAARVKAALDPEGLISPGRYVAPDV